MLAALVLVVQTFLSAWTGAAMAGQPTVDAFGNPLCISDAVQDTSAPAGGHGAAPACCALGCGAVSTVLPAPADHADLVAVEFPTTVPARAPSEPAPASRPDYDPGSPRAPPPSV